MRIINNVASLWFDSPSQIPLELSKTHPRCVIATTENVVPTALDDSVIELAESDHLIFLDSSAPFRESEPKMSPSESRKLRREARRATLRGVAAAPSFKAGKTRTRRSSLRRALIVTTGLSILVAMMLATPKVAKADFQVPEIDPGSMAGAMTLLVGGVLALTDRVRRS
jgi:hypothetical protein